MEVINPHTSLQSGLRESPRSSKKNASKSSATYTPSSSKARNVSKNVEKLLTLYNEANDVFYTSPLAKNLEGMLHAKTRPRVTKAVSLGLGSLGASKDQPRRIKQLVIFMAIASSLLSTADPQDTFSLYAQDPTFTKTDEEFLKLLGIQVLRTREASDLGEAGAVIDEETLIYSPFLTIEAYGKLFASVQNAAARSSAEAKVPILIGDDFNALKLKWEKRTAENREVESLSKIIRAESYQRKVINADGFWIEEDNAFPMALYWRLHSGARSKDGQKMAAPKKLRGKL